MNEVRTLAKQTMVYGLGTIVPRFLNYGVVTLFYTRIFTKAEYGIITELYAWMVFLLIILTYGMETGFFRFSQNSKDYDKVYSTTLISLLATSTAFLLLVNIFIRPVSAFLNYSNYPGYVRMFAAIVAIDAFTAIPFARLRRENRALLFSAIKIANVVIIIVSVIFFLLIAPGIYEKSNGWFREIYDPDFGVGYVFLANLIGSAATLILLIPFIILKKPVFDCKLWKRMMAYSLPLLITGLSGSVNDTLDKVILRRMMGEEDGLAILGEYGAGYKVAVLMALFIQMFRFAAEPFFFERAKQSDAKKTYAEVMKYFIIVMLIVYLAINLYLSGFQYIIGKDFRGALGIVPIVAMGYLLYGIYINHSIWYKLTDLTIFGIYITMIGAIVTVLINVSLIPVFGYLASAWAHVASYGSMIIMSFIFAEKRFKVDYGMTQFIPYFALAIAMVLFARYFNYPGIIAELAVNTALILIFIAFAQYRDNILTLVSRKK
ncbi:MAG: Polysaccharide biosynthesis protein [Bacteroidetes bacterium ADurb.Bin145]|nr:MAG: Polysaccharide biosynthesis protein [Bacteroidetes bacterium ADurb.Bin145]